MGSTAGGHHGAEPEPTEKKLEDLHDLIEGMEVCMFTTRRPNGHLVSRPMQIQERAAGADLWFVTNIESNRLDELAYDPHVNLAFYRDGTREWVSIVGTACVSQDRALFRTRHHFLFLAPIAMAVLRTATHLRGRGSERRLHGSMQERRHRGSMPRPLPPPAIAGGQIWPHRACEPPARGRLPESRHRTGWMGHFRSYL